MARFMPLAFALALVPALSRAATPAVNVCFVPGMAGSNDYFFKQIPATLSSRGIRFVPIDVGRLGLIQDRAKRLGEAIRDLRAQEPAFRCHLFAHSLGGLTARYALTHDAVVKDAALSYTSFSSPHRGTPAADVLKAVLPNLLPGLEQAGVAAVSVFDDAANAAYSPALPDLPYLSYRTFLGNAEQALDWGAKVGFVLMWQDLFFKGLDPLNDGLIPLASQDFGKVVSDVKVEHAYFGDLTQVKPPVADFFEMHAYYVTDRLETYKTKKPAEWKSLRQAFDLKN